jgi:hypothetical protein
VGRHRQDARDFASAVALLDTWSVAASRHLPA